MNETAPYSTMIPSTLTAVIVSLLAPVRRFSKISPADVKKFLSERYSNDVSDHWDCMAQTFPSQSIQKVLKNLRTTRNNNRDQHGVLVEVDLEFIRKAR